MMWKLQVWHLIVGATWWTVEGSTTQEFKVTPGTRTMDSSRAAAVGDADHGGVTLPEYLMKEGPWMRRRDPCRRILAGVLFPPPSLAWSFGCLA